MDSHCFRLIAAELIQLLDGARLEKIHEPRPGLFSFLFFDGRQKRQLLFRPGRPSPLLLFSEVRLDNPPRPTSRVMRIRKFFAGKRLGRAVVDFVARAIAFPLLSGDSSAWLFLDMNNGAFVLDHLPDGFGVAPTWPDADTVAGLCGPERGKGETENIWQQYPVLTPLLRETLACLDPLDGRALMVDLEAGGGDLFVYRKQDGTPGFYSAWPLPLPLQESRRFEPYSMDGHDALKTDPCPALTIVGLVDGPRLFSEVTLASEKQAVITTRKASKKQTRLLHKLGQEKERLTHMLHLREDAVTLQGLLWRYPDDPKLEYLDWEDEQGQAGRIALNPLLTLRQNMVRLFKESARGRRGLAMLDKRMADVISNPEPEDGPTAKETTDRSAFVLPGREIKDVAVFRSSDGFTMLRGKNARGNQRLLKIGKGHDLWLHAEDGPSAHLIIRRSHGGEDIPEKTLREAAILVGEKSWQRSAGKAAIMVALLRNVHAIKGAAPGTVRVEAVQETLVVSMSSALKAAEPFKPGENPFSANEEPGQGMP